MPTMDPAASQGLTELFDLNKPVIMAINGMAVGGGFELALAADLIVAAEHAEFFLPEVNIGMIASSGGVLRLPRCLPPAIAMEMQLTGPPDGRGRGGALGACKCGCAGGQPHGSGT